MDNRYARAVELVVDLRDLSARKGEDAAFFQRLQVLRAAHARRAINACNFVITRRISV